MLAESNDLFADFVRDRGPAAKKWYVKEVPSGVRSIAPGEDQNAENARVFKKVDSDETEGAYPIIPLTPRMLTPIEIPDRDLPDPDTVDLDRLERRLRDRLSAVAGVLLRQDLPELINLGPLGWASSFPAQHYISLVAGQLALKKVNQGLDDIRAAFPRRR